MFSEKIVREIEVDNGKKIRVYDDVFDMEYRSLLYSFVNSSYFKIGWADGNIIENQKHRFLHAFYSDEDLQKINLLEKIKSTHVAEEMVGYKYSKCVANLSTPSDVNFVHVHPEDKILLYYVNLEWRDGWHGETLFYDESGKEVLFASSYTPGRLIAFDAKIPHTIRPQSHISSFYRFTLAILFNKC